MPRRSLIGFIILNVIVTFAVTTLIIMLRDNSLGASADRPSNDPVVVVITATPDVNAPQAGVTVVVVTATGDGSAAVPQGTPAPPNLNLPTLDPSLIPADLTPVDVENALASAPTDASGCPTYVIKEGDILGKIAPAFDVTVAEIIAANNFTDRDVQRLQIGQTILIPRDGCGLPTPTEAPTEAPTPSLTPPPSATAAPTSSVAELEIVQVTNAGDITAESIEIRNTGEGQIELTGWKLKNGAGDEFTFPNSLLFKGATITVFTRAGGTNTPRALYWGLTEPAFPDGNGTITLEDDEGKVQLRYTQGTP